MNCPYCEQSLPKLKTYMHVCPYCHTIINNKLKTNILPRKEYNSPMTIYEMPKEYLLAIGKKRYTTMTSLHKNIQKKHRLFSIWAHILGFIFTLSTVFFWIDGEDGLCIVSFIIAFFMACCIFKENYEHTNKMKMLYSSDSDIPMAVSFYGNDEIFGIVSVPANCNDSDAIPQIHRTEIPKSQVIGVVQEDEQDFWVDIQYVDTNHKIHQHTIPIFCSLASLHKLLGIK